MSYPADGRSRDGESTVRVRELRKLVKRRTNELCQAGLRDDAQLTDEEVARVARLRQLLAWRDASWKRWVAPAMLAGIMIAVTILLVVRMPETEIELDVTVTEVAFTVAERQPLLDNAAVTVLGASGLQQADLGSAGEGASVPTGSLTAPVSLRLSVVAGLGGPSKSTIDLSRWVVPAGTRVWLGATSDPRTYRISTKGPEADLTASVKGVVTVAIAGQRPERLTMAVPRPIRLRTQANDVADFDLSLARGSGIEVSQQVLVEDLSFARVEPFVDTERETPIRTLSTVVKGALFMSALNDERWELRAGQALRLQGSRGELRNVALGDGVVHVNFYGSVHGLETGTVANPVNLMPSLLEWLRARQPLVLMWGTTVSLFFLVLAVLR